MISIKDFYLIAGVLMIVSVAGSIWNLVLIWNNITIGAKVSSIAGGIFFQCLLCVLFLGLYKTTPKQMIPDSSLDNLVQEIQNKNVEQLNHRGKK
jgi:hypothetical protein